MKDPPSIPDVARTTLTFSNSLESATLSSDEIRDFVLPIPNGERTITGKLLGFASSHRLQHSSHDDEYARPGEKCPACRWFEARIFSVDPKTSEGRHFAVHTQGPTIVPGEYVKCRLAFAMTGYEVIELLTVRKGDAIFIPAASSRAISQAAGLSRGIETAYVNRAVA